MADCAAMHESAVDLAVCPNCHAALDGPFCAKCGQKVGPLNPSVADFLHELFHEIAHVDGKIVQSVRLLLARPGFLSREQFDGRRVRYVAPIRLYLALSVFFFAVVAFAPLKGPRVSCTTCAAEEKPRIEAEMREAVAHWIPRAMFVLVPLLAAFVGLMARRSGRTYPQHLYFSLHLHAAWFFMLAFSAIIGLVPGRAGPVFGVMVIVWALLYFVLAFHRAYRATMVRSIVTAVLVTGVYLFAVVAAVFVIILPFAARG